MLDIIILIIIIFILPYYIYKPKIPIGIQGQNASDFIESFLIYAQNWIKTYPLWHFAEAYKTAVNKMRANEFNTWKMYGVIGTAKEQNKASRGYDKLQDILLSTKLQFGGDVLSLCCGRGGWEQVVAALPQVKTIYSYTLGPGAGHRGHEAFTEKPFEGRHKVLLQYADATTLPNIPANLILFDGGESHPQAEVEALRALKLLKGCVDHQITHPEQQFILKVLNPCHPEVLKYLEELQKRTGKGSLYRSAHSRNSTLEMYFVSTRPTNLARDIRSQLHHVFMRAATKRIEKARQYMPDEFARPKIIPKKNPILEPMDYSKSIHRLGTPLNEPGRTFAQWESIGVYPCGFTGSKTNNIPRIAHELTYKLMDNLPGMQDWISTDTTPEGFTKTFLTKIDVGPEENTPHDEKIAQIYAGFAKHYKNKGLTLRELTWAETEEALNKQGAAHFLDIGINSISEFLALPNWIQIVEEVRKEIENGTPDLAIAATIGKREKKESPRGPKGSRMIAYYPIAMRVLETKVFGQLDKLTKPDNNRFLVGGVGLHDLGELLRRRYKEVAESTDIAGFDTRIGVRRLSDEAAFCRDMGLGPIARQIYRIYAYPLILVPMPAAGLHRTELLRGRGQRLSGSRVTYPMNSLTRLAIELLRWVDVFEIPHHDIPDFIARTLSKQENADISGMGSGDDFVSLFPERYKSKFAATKSIFHDIGFPRKDIPVNIDTPITRHICEVEFCSHNYEPVTFFQASTGATVVRHMPTRPVAEIIGKARTWLGGSMEGGSAEAWISTQGVNLLMHYPHLRTTRALGLAYKAAVAPNLLLTATGFELHRRPWMQPGDILEVFNRLHFGESTMFPIPGFTVERFSHLGYLKPNREILYDPQSFTSARERWRNTLHITTLKIINTYHTGGSLEPLNLWRPSPLQSL